MRAKRASHWPKWPFTAKPAAHSCNPEEKHPKQSADNSIHAKHAPQNPQRLQMPRHPWDRYIQRHRRLLMRLIHRRRHAHHLRSASRAKVNTFRNCCTTCLTDHLTPPYIRAHSLLRIPPASSSLRDYDRRSEIARSIAVDPLPLARIQRRRARVAPPSRPHCRPHLVTTGPRLDSCT